MDRTTRDRVLTVLDECDIGLPEDGLTLEKIREWAFGFQFESDEMLSFRIERHPTMYLSGMGVLGLDASPARFHVVTAYRLNLTDGDWHIEELSSTFEYEPWMVIEAELGEGPVSGSVSSGTLAGSTRTPTRAIGFSVSADIRQPMQTETWIERALIDQLTTHDRRYKYDYGGVDKTTDDLVTACWKLDLIATGDGPELPPIEQLLVPDADLESEVETTLEILEERGLIERAGECDRLGPPFEPGDYGTTTIWRPTVEGRAEARAIREAYSSEVNELAESHGTESDEFSEEIASIARTYGILPSYFG